MGAVGAACVLPSPLQGGGERWLLTGPSRSPTGHCPPRKASPSRKVTHTPGQPKSNDWWGDTKALTPQTQIGIQKVALAPALPMGSAETLLQLITVPPPLCLIPQSVHTKRPPQ